MDDVGPMRRLLNPIARALAGGIGLFTLANLLGGFVSPGFDANHWWIDLRAWPGPLANCFLACFSALLLAFACRPVMSVRRQVATGFFVLVAMIVTMINAITCFQLAYKGSITTPSLVPLSLFVTLVMAVLFADIAWPKRNPPQREAARLVTWLIGTSSFVLLLLAFPIAQIYCFGTTSYARQVDVIIVPGARAYADGSPSLPLADRVRSACDLYHRGFAGTLLFSGGPGDGDIHETESMRRFAVSLGVPDEAIVLDPQGISTQATVDHTLPMLDRLDADRVMVVSHFYHLPRLKLTYQRQGREVFTVPAKESRTLRAMPMYLLREVAALWWYYVRPVLG